VQWNDRGFHLRGAREKRAAGCSRWHGRKRALQCL
jgi:hypothetical protein